MCLCTLSDSNLALTLGSGVGQGQLYWFKVKLVCVMALVVFGE